MPDKKTAGFGQPAIFNAVPPSFNDGESGALQINQAGELKTTGGGGSGIAAAQTQGNAADNTPQLGNPVLSGAEYNATPQVYDDGDVANNQADQNGYLKNREQYAPLAEDNVNGVIKVEQRYTPANITTAATTVIKTGSGYVDQIRVIGGTLGAVTVYDNTAGSGTLLVPTVTPTGNGSLIEHATFSTGLTIVTAAATIIVITYR